MDLARRSEGAPDALRDAGPRLCRRGRGVAASAETLGAAGSTALEATLGLGPGAAARALDLLAADALVTLALQAQAEHDPAGLGAFAAGALPGRERRRP